MAVETAGAARTSFELKSAQLPVVAVALKTTDAAVLAADLAARLADDPGFFDNDPVLIDLAAGLVAAPEAPPARPAAPAPVREVIREVVREVEVPVAGPTTVVLDKPLRSGQQVYARGGDLVVMAVVSFGAEVIADGNIHIYAPMRGRAIAGARGNTGARIFSTCLEPQLLSIAGIYRTTETELPDNVRGKPAQVRLDGEKLLIEPL